VTVANEKSPKNQAIAATLKATRVRRKEQTCRVYELKVNRSKLNATSRVHLERFFLEAKWFYNWVLIQDDPFNVDTTVQTIPVKVGAEFEARDLRCLSSQMKQGLATQVQDAIKALAKLKENGRKVGHLKFKRQVCCIPLKQYAVTYQLYIDRQRVKLQRLKQHLRVHGCAQFPAGIEFANAQLLERHGDYFLHVVTYHPKTTRPCTTAPPQAIGIDAGLQQQLTFSNGVAVEYRVPVPKRLRRQYRRFSWKHKGSRNRRKDRLKLEKLFSKLTHIKKDIRNQLVAYLCRNYAIVCYQKENLAAWQRLWGKKMLDISLGAFFRILEERSRTPTEIKRSFPSTQRCSRCGHKQKLPLQERVYHCPDCGLLLDRDYNAALNLLLEGQGLTPSLGPGRTEVTPVETPASTQCMLDCFASLPYVRASRVAEAGRS